MKTRGKMKTQKGLECTEQPCSSYLMFLNIQMAKTTRCSATCLSVLVLVEGHSIGTVLIMIDAVFSLLAKLEVLAECPLHHHLLASRADTGDVTLCIYY